MKRVFKIVIVLIALGSLFFSCSKKYPEDGFHYVFKSPEKRIVGTWRITKYYINGADATNFLFDQYVGWGQYGFNTGPLKYQYGIIDFDIGNADPYGEHEIPSLTIDGGGELSFQNDEDYLKISFGIEYGNISNNPPLYNPFRVSAYTTSGSSDVSSWKINELTNISLKIANTINDTAYQIEFAKQ